MLDKYISEVLFKHHTCTIPLIGTFQLDWIAAEYKISDQQLHPPKQQISFNTYWEDDGSCAKWIARELNIVPTVARIKMDKFIQDLQQQLQEGQTVNFPGIGQLKKGTNGKYSFQAEAIASYFQPFAVQKVVKPEEPIRVLQGHHTVEKDSPAKYDANVFDQERKPTRLGLWIGLGALLALGAAAWFYKDEISQLFPSQNPPPPIQEPVQKQVHDSEFQEQTDALLDSLGAQPILQEASIPTSDSIEYYVVFQTFQFEETATKNLRNRKAWGYPEIVMFRAYDSTRYNLAVPFKSMPADTTYAKDSIFKKFSQPVFIVPMHP